jgi:hypothetical protein
MKYFQNVRLSRRNKINEYMWITTGTESLPFVLVGILQISPYTIYGEK